VSFQWSSHNVKNREYTLPTQGVQTQLSRPQAAVLFLDFVLQSCRNMNFTTAVSYKFGRSSRYLKAATNPTLSCIMRDGKTIRLLGIGNLYFTKEALRPPGLCLNCRRAA